MFRFWYAAVMGCLGAVLNDTAAKNGDLAKFTANQLTDERNRLISVTDQYEAKGDKLTADELTSYRNDIERLEAVVNCLNTTAVGLAERDGALVAGAYPNHRDNGLFNAVGVPRCAFAATY